MNWSPSSHIVWTHGWRTLKTVCDKDPIYNNIDSEAILIKKRALSGYGLRVSLKSLNQLEEKVSSTVAARIVSAQIVSLVREIAIVCQSVACYLVRCAWAVEAAAW